MNYFQQFLILFLSLILASPAFGQQKLYWSTSETDDSIYRANLDGSMIEKIVNGKILGNSINSIQIDDIGGKIYWINPDDNEIRRYITLYKNKI